MEPAKISRAREERINSIDNALRVLNEAARDSADDIRTMANRDYNRVREVLLSNPSPQQSEPSFLGLRGVEPPDIERVKQRVVETAQNASRQVDASAHKNPWAFIGISAGLSAVVGYLLGRRIGRG